MRIPLSDSELRTLGFIGCLRFQNTMEQGQEMKQSGAGGLNIVIDGVISEYAVAKYLNVHFDVNSDYRKFGADLVSRKGKLIDVKSTRKEGGNLNAVLWSSKKPADIYILTEIYFDYVLIIGYINREDFLIEENITDIGNGQFYSVSQSKLKPL